MYDYENSPEEVLIRKAKRGDVKAFSRLYAQIYKDLYRFALYMTKHPQDAEDAVGETVLSAYKNISSLKKENSFKSWMFKILSNQCRKLLQKKQKESVSELYPSSDTAAGGLDYAQQYDVRRAFEALDEEERMILAFSVFGGYQSDEIAEMLDKSAGTVRSKKSRALEKMRDMLS